MVIEGNTGPVTDTARSPLSAAFSLRRPHLSLLRDYAIVVAFVTLFVVLSFSSDVFLTWRNIFNILDQNAPIGILAVGVTLVFIAGGFDVSVGAVYAIAGVAAAQLVPSVGVYLAVALAMLLGLGFGVVNGVLTTVGRMNSFIVTLTSSIMIGGIALVMTDGFLVTVTDEDFAVLGSGSVGLVKYTVFVWFGFALVCGFLLSRTVYGRHVYAVGGNPEAARLSGVRVNLVRIIAFAISGMAAAVGGILVASRISTGQADAGGISLAVLVIAAVVIGGTSILGGEGAIWRTILGVLLLALISNGFNLMGVNPIYQDIVRGGIIFLAVGLDAWARYART
jgi:ribose transport system permease protein